MGASVVVEAVHHSMGEGCMGKRRPRNAANRSSASCRADPCGTKTGRSTRKRCGWTRCRTVPQAATVTRVRRGSGPVKVSCPPRKAQTPSGYWHFELPGLP